MQLNVTPVRGRYVKNVFIDMRKIFCVVFVTMPFALNTANCVMFVIVLLFAETVRRNVRSVVNFFARSVKESVNVVPRLYVWVEHAELKYVNPV